jgi:dTDP-4-amino-4,6-dideoxygalactose transaminase
MGLSPTALEKWFRLNVQIGPPGKVEAKNDEPKSYDKRTGKPISACVPMHTFGHPCRIDEIVEICQRYHVPVVEDAAESLGSFYKKQHTGTFGRIGILSFNGNKIITTGGGGMLLFQDEELAIKAKHLTTQAKLPHPWEFVHDDIGYNYRMPNINAALGLGQIEQLPVFLKSKRRLAGAYQEFFSNSAVASTFTFIPEPPNAMSNYWLNCVLLKNRTERDAFLKYTNENGVMTRPTWRLMHRLPMYEECPAGNLTNSVWLEERLVNLPSSVPI